MAFFFPAELSQMSPPGCRYQVLEGGHMSGHLAEFQEIPPPLAEYCGGSHCWRFSRQQEQWSGGIPLLCLAAFEHHRMRQYVWGVRRAWVPFTSNAKRVCLHEAMFASGGGPFQSNRKGRGCPWRLPLRRDLAASAPDAGLLLCHVGGSTNSPSCGTGHARVRVPCVGEGMGCMGRVTRTRPRAHA
jgi:hypothetical protein